MRRGLQHRSESVAHPGPVRGTRRRGPADRCSLEEYAASEFFFPVRDGELYRYSDWFLLSCVMLPWAVEQYDAALVPAG